MKNKIYFSDHFNISHQIIDQYGALDISLICDNPAFVDPFLIFANPKYKNLHDFIIKYLSFLKDISVKNKGEGLTTGIYNHYYKFPEVKQTWLGYSINGNEGLGLGPDFASSLYKNLNKIFSEFGAEKITETSHIEKLCLVEEGIGADKISDFTLNLIKKYLLEFTQEFATKYIDRSLLSTFSIRKTDFDFNEGLWKDGQYTLPKFYSKGKKDYIILVPKNLLTKQNTWISKDDFIENDTTIFDAINNDELRIKINKFFYDNLEVKVKKYSQIEKDFSKKSKRKALIKTLMEYPMLLDFYIKLKEQLKHNAIKKHIADPEYINFFLDTTLIQEEIKKQNFGKLASFEDCISRIEFFKKTLESNSNSLYLRGKPVHEKQLQLMFKMTTYDSLLDYNSEVNNGSGPIDFIISLGSRDKIGLELKRASNTKLKQNLLMQTETYKNESNLKHVIKLIFYFSDGELERVRRILEEVRIASSNNDLFLIDCRKKPSASNIK